MTTTAQQLMQGSLRIRSASPAPKDPKAWKNLVGTKPVTARFSLLPETKPRLSALGTSLIVQICLVAIAVTLPLMFPQQLIPQHIFFVTDLAGPPLDIPAPPKLKPPVPPKMKVEPPRPVEPPPTPKPAALKYFAPPIAAPKAKIRTVETEVPKVNSTFQPLNMASDDRQPTRPRDPVKTGMLSSGSSAAPTIPSRPVDKVQTGGFGDPDGVAGPSNPNKQANVGQFGNAALPPGPGYGNGSGGANGARGIIASTGFGNGVAIPPASNRHTGAIKTGGFADENQQVAIESPRRKSEDVAAVEPVVILAKPKPVYTAEALKLNLEGEVLLDVVFPASGGAVQVNRVVKGLGHGLDEAAIRAAQGIKYKPALSSGHPVDFPAVVHIVFQIAY